MLRALVVAIALQALSASATNPAFAGFADLPLDFSASIPSLQVLGTIPSHIEGTLFRNGPVNFASLNATHWFDGMGMLHAFAIKNGQVSYTAQYIRSAIYNQTINPCKRLFENSGADFVSSSPGASSSHSSSLSSNVGISHASVNTLVTIRRVAGHWISNTGFPSSNEFDPVTLNTVAAPFQYNDDLPSDNWGAPEHAQTDPAGEVVHYFFRFDDPQYQIYSIAPGSSTRVNIGRVPVNPLVGVPLYQHSFGLTEQYVILSEVPCTFGQTGWTSFQWIPNLPVTWRVVSRATGIEVANFTSKPFFMMHHVHAYENPADHTVVVDLIMYPDNSILDALYLSTIQNKPDYLAQVMMAGKVARFALPMGTPGVDVEPTILGPFLEMPIVNPIFQFHPYNYLYGITYSDKLGSAGFLDAITQLNLETGESKLWSEKGCYPSEPIFVPNPGAVHELDGVLLSVLLDVSKNQSFLLILDASDLSEIARAYVPNHIPYGFHGAYSNSLSGKVFHS